VKIGTEGYTSAGSLLFFVDPYYTQIVSTKDDARFADFATEMARRIAARQAPASSEEEHGEGKPAKPADLSAVAFGLLPAGSGRSEPKFVAQDVFGYGFLSDVFMADYKDGEVTWQGYIRPYATAEEAREVFEKYLASAKQDGGDTRPLQAEGADRMIINSNVGLVDVVFLKGNVVGGANGSTDAAKAESFARAFVKSLPAELPKAPPAEKKPPTKAEGEES